MCYFTKKKEQSSNRFFDVIVRPVKRDWAVLSKDTPLDMSILKLVIQSVFNHLWNAL